MHRLLRTVFAAALVLAPLGAQAADLVVWWEQGFYPQEDEAVREIIAAFEQETGKQVELEQPSLNDIAGQGRRPRLKQGSPPISLFGLRMASFLRPMGLRGPAGRPLGCDRAASRTCSTRTRSRYATLLNATTGRARPLRAADRVRSPPMSTSGGTCSSRPDSPSMTSRNSGRRSGRSGATRPSRRCGRRWAATTSRASACPCRPTGRHTGTSSSSSFRPTRPIM